MGRSSFRKLNIDSLNIFYHESGQDDPPAIRPVTWVFRSQMSRFRTLRMTLPQAKPSRIFKFHEIREAHRVTKANDAREKMVVVAR